MHNIKNKTSKNGREQRTSKQSKSVLICDTYISVLMLYFAERRTVYNVAVLMIDVLGFVLYWLF